LSEKLAKWIFDLERTMSSILIWYRNDLRIHDHEPLAEALKQNTQIVPVYCFDPRQFGKTSFGFPKTGKFRAQFLLEGVADLRSRLQALGSNLVVRIGKPEEILPKLAKEVEAKALYFYEEVASEELRVEAAVIGALEPLELEIQSFWGATLFHPEDLPFTIERLPEVFTDFRKQVEAGSSVVPVFVTPTKLPSLSNLDTGIMPTLEDFDLAAPEFDERAVMRFQGGEQAGMARLKEYFWEKSLLKTYKETRNGMLGADYSSKFSPWLALGCLSPRYIYEQVKAYETQRIKNDSTYWLIFELLWRDYFQFIVRKHGKKIFRPSGLRGVTIPWQQDWKRFELWCAGETGYPLIDANMQELAATGFMSNRGRQNVASFLTKNLGIDWRMGAEWFESLLIDYDVASNWGNWNYSAGVGNDARGFRYFNILKQAQDYDPNGQYVQHWLPALVNVPAKKVHEPWKLLSVEQQRYGVQLGVDYPHPIVDLAKSVQHNEEIYNAAHRNRKR
jgi:deoxyribodipyrimidine photo-lyase